MPEFKPTKRNRMSQDELMREYRGEKPEKVKKAKKKQPLHKPSKRKQEKIIQQSKTQNPPVSPVRQLENERRRLERERIEKERKKNEKLKKRNNRRKKKRNMLLYYILIAVVTVTTLSILSVTVLFNVSSIEIVNNEKYTDEQVIAAAGVSEGDNLVRMNTASIEEKILEKLIYVDTASVERHFPNKLKIVLTTADPMAEIYYDGSYYVLSYREKLLAVADNQHHTERLVRGLEIDAQTAQVGKILPDTEDKKVELIHKIVTGLDQNKLFEKCRIDVTDTMAITILYDDRISIDFGAGIQIEEKLYAAGVLINEKLDDDEKIVMMLSNPERVVTRPIHDSGDTAVTTPPETEPPSDTQNLDLPE